MCFIMELQWANIRQMVKKTSFFTWPKIEQLSVYLFFKQQLPTTNLDCTGLPSDIMTCMNIPSCPQYIIVANFWDPSGEYANILSVYPTLDTRIFVCLFRRLLQTPFLYFSFCWKRQCLFNFFLLVLSSDFWIPTNCSVCPCNFQSDCLFLSV